MLVAETQRKRYTHLSSANFVEHYKGERLQEQTETEIFVARFCYLLNICLRTLLLAFRQLCCRLSFLPLFGL
jgi:hypothetical protein